MEKLNDYICHSGGCGGADMAWETEGNKYGIKTISYSFNNHVQNGKNKKILSAEELSEGWQNVLMANKTLKRYPQGQSQYVKNLLSRNWFQVKNSDCVFAIGKFDKNGKVSGGTGWAVQMSIDNCHGVYVFDQNQNKWFEYIHLLDGSDESGFIEMNVLPILSKNFAGIGTRDLQENGLNAIKDVYKRTIEFLNNK